MQALGMHTIYITTHLVHKTSNENGRGTQTEVASFTGSHTHKQWQKVGLVSCSQTDETGQTDKTDVGYTYRIFSVRCRPRIVATHVLIMATNTHWVISRAVRVLGLVSWQQEWEAAHTTTSIYHATACTLIGCHCYPPASQWNKRHPQIVAALKRTAKRIVVVVSNRRNTTTRGVIIRLPLI